MNGEAYQEGYSTCPFEPSHRILRHRLQVHLVKCAKNHPDSGLVFCVFNRTHVVPEAELKHHLEICPDKIQIDQFLVEENDDHERIKIDFAPQEDCYEEDWNTTQQNYDPAEYCKNKPLLRRKDILSAAQKREFHLAETKRFQELEMEQKKTAIRTPRTHLPKPAANVQQEVPDVVAARMKKTVNTLQNPTVRPPSTKPLSEILNSARAPGQLTNQTDEGWTVQPTRGRGRGIRKYK